MTGVVAFTLFTFTRSKALEEEIRTRQPRDSDAQLRLSQAPGAAGHWDRRVGRQPGGRLIAMGAASSVVCDLTRFHTRWPGSPMNHVAHD